MWTISGLPCKHVASCIAKSHKKIEDYCHEYYSNSMYMKSYSSIVHPLPNLGLLKEADVAPPTLARLPGRPKTSQIRQPDEA